MNDFASKEIRICDPKHTKFRFRHLIKAMKLEERDPDKLGLSVKISEIG